MQSEATGKLAGSVTVFATVIAVVATCGAAAAQWPDYPMKIPRTPRPLDWLAPAPRTSDGKPDLSGIWLSERDPAGVAGGIEGIVAPRYMIDITKDLKREDVPFQPWAAALHQERIANSFRDNPMLQCLPAGVPRLDAYTHPYKIVQTPGLVVILDELMTLFRQIFMDGRELPNGSLNRRGWDTRSVGGKATRWLFTPRVSTTKPGSMAAAIRIAKTCASSSGSGAATSDTWISRLRSTIPKCTRSR